jgi:hypothetical protein
MPYKDKEKERENAKARSRRYRKRHYKSVLQRNSEYKRIRHAELRSKWFSENGPCRWCGSYKDLEVDHINPKLKVSHKIWAWSDKRREAELLKCQALCYYCHREKSRLEAMVDIATRHGTLTGYQNKKCRCNECKALWSKYLRDWRIKNEV